MAALENQMLTRSVVLKATLICLTLVAALIALGAGKTVREVSSPYIRSTVQGVFGNSSTSQTNQAEEERRTSPGQFDGFFREMAQEENTKLKNERLNLEYELNNIKKYGPISQQNQKLRQENELLEKEINIIRNQ